MRGCYGSLMLGITTLGGFTLYQKVQVQPKRRSPAFSCGISVALIRHTRNTTSESEVAQSCPTLCDPMNCSLPCSSVYGIFLARVLEWVAIFFSRHHSSKTSILRCSIFFMVQLSHPQMTTGKAIALTRWTFASKVMPMLFNTLSRFVIAFLPRSKCL